MLDQFFRDGASAHRLRASLFGPHLDSFAALVSRLGYARSTVQTQLRLLVDLGRWLTRHWLGVRDLGTDAAAGFLRKRRRAGGVRRGDLHTLRLFLHHLRADGVIPHPAPKVDGSSLGILKTRYEEYLRKGRGLSPVTGPRYWPFLQRLLLERFQAGPIHLGELKPQDVTRFLLRRAHARSPKGAQTMVCALRSFFRFLYQHGDTAQDLSAAVLPIPSWRLAEVPKYLTPAEVARLLASCDRTCAAGRRDYTLLLLLARLGLRAGEVVRLELDDIDWRAGELLVRGKGSFHDRLPLPQDVGNALAAYLRTDRPPCSTRCVFVRMRAPRRGFNHPSTVSTIVRRAVERAGLAPPTKGAHLLRHSLATGLLRQGASLAEIGEVLRHRSPNTTEIYAKVDLDALRALARPWPRNGGGR